MQLTDRYSARNYHPLPVVLSRGEGVWVEDSDGKRYMDMLACYSAVNQGHCHPRIKAAMVAQLDRLTLTSRAFLNDRMGGFLKKLCELSGFDKALPMNTGAEAVETGLKAVRKWGYKVKGVPEGQAEIIVCADNFHGRTTTIVGFSTEPQYRDGFGPFAPGFKVVPYGDIAALEAAFTANTVAFLVEPVQGEAGIIVPPEGYLKEARALCDNWGALLFLDEIQSGFGRTGRMFAFEHEGIRPDCMTVGKALSGGFYPVSAFLASAEVMGVFNPGDHGSTFGGNPLASAVAEAALDVLVEENLVVRAEELGAYLMEQLRGIHSPHIDHVRGVGLFIGIVIKDSSGPARPFCERLMEQGVLAKETHHQVIRLAPPLVITKDEIDWALVRLRAVLGA
ncbi:MAG: ornithine--oxo-acid transaminase [Pseudomonadota bacterium]